MILCKHWFLTLISLCRCQQIAILFNNSTEFVNTTVDSVQIYLDDTIFSANLPFIDLSNANQSIIDISLLISLENKWVIYKLFKIINSKPDLLHPFNLDDDLKLLLTKMNQEEWKIFDKTCNMLGLVGNISDNRFKSDLWRYIEFFRLSIPEKLQIILTYKVMCNNQDLASQYTPMTHECYCIFAVNRIDINNYTITPETLDINNVNIFMLDIKQFQTYIDTKYFAYVSNDISKYPDLKDKRIYFRVLGIKDRIFSNKYTDYGWDAHIDNKGIGNYIFGEDILPVIGYQAESFFYSITHSYGFDKHLSWYKIVRSSGLQVQFEFISDETKTIV